MQTIVHTETELPQTFCRNCNHKIFQVEPGIWSHVDGDCDDPDVDVLYTRQKFNLIPVDRACLFCHETTRLFLPEAGFVAYFYQNKFVQEAFPYLSATLREIIINGMCLTCQADFYKESNDV